MIKFLIAFIGICLVLPWIVKAAVVVAAVIHVGLENLATTPESALFFALMMVGLAVFVCLLQYATEDGRGSAKGAIWTDFPDTDSRAGFRSSSQCAEQDRAVGYSTRALPDYRGIVRSEHFPDASHHAGVDLVSPVFDRPDYQRRSEDALWIEVPFVEEFEGADRPGPGDAMSGTTRLEGPDHFLLARCVRIAKRLLAALCDSLCPHKGFNLPRSRGAERRPDLVDRGRGGEYALDRPQGIRLPQDGLCKLIGKSTGE